MSARSALAKLSTLTGIGEPGLARRRAALAWALLRMAAGSLREGMAVKNRALAFKVFGGLTLLFGYAIHTLLNEIPWNKGGGVFACLGALGWLILMGFATSTGWSNVAALLRSRFPDTSAGSWRMRSAEQASANERWHLGASVSGQDASPAAPRRRL